nr:MAG TPA: hypothetical protein [Caudoviricetes sp.]
MCGNFIEKYSELKRAYVNLKKDNKRIYEENLKLNKLIEKLKKGVYGDCNYCKYDEDYQLNAVCECCNSYASFENSKGCFWELKDFD